MDEEQKRKARAMFMNRQPTLWRHGIAGVTVEPTDKDDDDTIHVGPATLEAFNMD